MANTMMMNDPKRASLEARVFERLQHLDDATLNELDAWLAQPVAEGQPQPQRGMTRRQALVALLLGGAAVAGAGVTGSLVGESGALTEGAARIAGMNDTIDQWRTRAEQMADRVATLEEQASTLGSRLESTQGLVGLYDELDNVGLDDVVRGGLNTVATMLGALAEAAQRLREGLVVAQNNVNQLDEGLAILDRGLENAESVVTRLSGLMQGLEDRLREAGEPIAPLTEALGSFFTGLVSRIPFGVGERILVTIERIQAVIGAVPESIENINRDLIEPLRARFFPREGDDVHVRLIEPLTNLIFTPADRLLTQLATLGETWRSELERPAREKIEAREAIRKQISQYRLEKGL